jgi:cysteine desulfurase
VAARAYLDHASTSPLRPTALEAMLPFLREHHGDPGRIHAEGRATRVAIETAREQVAAFVGARPREVVFTSGGTEAVNHAISGAVRRSEGATRIVTTAVEHSSVLDASRRISSDVAVVGVDTRGHVAAEEVAAAITTDTALVTVQLANHEVGTIQPVAEICALARERDVLVHVDACAAIGYLPFSFRELDADLLSVSAHTFGGPKGAGALLIRRGLLIPPLLLGGSQERARRGGLENVPAIVGFGAAAEEGTGTLGEEIEHERALSDSLAAAALGLDGVVRYGDPEHRLPNLVCLGVGGVEAEPILLALDQRGIAVHSGSACSSEALEPSPVLAAMGVDAEHSLRASVGWSSTQDDVAAFARELPGIVDRFRSLRATSPRP